MQQRSQDLLGPGVPVPACEHRPADGFAGRPTRLLVSHAAGLPPSPCVSRAARPTCDPAGSARYTGRGRRRVRSRNVPSWHGILPSESVTLRDHSLYSPHAPSPERVIRGGSIHAGTKGMLSASDGQSDGRTTVARVVIDVAIPPPTAILRWGERLLDHSRAPSNRLPQHRRQTRTRRWGTLCSA